MSAAEVLAQSLQDTDYDWSFEFGRDAYMARARKTLETLKAAGYVVVELPSVAHNGPHDTDAKFFRQVADRMEWPSKRIDYVGGSNVRQAVRQLLVRAADAAEAQS